MTKARRRVAVVTGTRAEFGLLTPVIRAIRADKRLDCQLIAAGSHFLPPARTIREVEAAFPVAAQVRMQRTGHRSRHDDALATARGVEGCARAFARLKPDWVLVLGDRIEAFAAASAAAIAGVGVAHIHGGDRAEGIADESMRHAITKLAHLHLAATAQSADRIVRMGELPERVHVVGSPAMDGLRAVEPMSDRDARALGNPRTVVLLHPSGLSTHAERGLADALARAVAGSCSSPVLVLAPNHDAGRDVVVRSLRSHRQDNWTFVEHLPRSEFVSLLKRLATPRAHGVLVGNSSAGLIEAAACGLPVVNVGPRQEGRERAANVLDVPADGPRLSDRISDTLARAFNRPPAPGRHPYGNGRAGPRIARLLARTDPHDPALLRKRNTY
jgi:UDP-hydrolysing UDP-N-acetyl-D-glucosamine 2-epimerase